MDAGGRSTGLVRAHAALLFMAAGINVILVAESNDDFFFLILEFVTGEGDMWNDLFLIRVLFVLVVTVAAYWLEPFGLGRPWAALAGLAVGVGIVLFEIRLRQISLKRLIGAAIGSVLGILGAFLMSLSTIIVAINAQLLRRMDLGG